MIKLVKILKTVLREAEEVNQPKVEPNPMEEILRVYHRLHETLIELMGTKFRDYIDGIFITAGKPTTFKIHLKNKQYFFLMYTRSPQKERGIYEATVSGKRYLLVNRGNTQRATLSISRLLRFGPSLHRLTPGEESVPGETPTETPKEPPAEIPHGEVGKVEEPTGTT
jgi:hypothetical protein